MASNLVPGTQKYGELDPAIGLTGSVTQDPLVLLKLVGLLLVPSTPRLTAVVKKSLINLRLLKCRMLLAEVINYGYYYSLFCR